LTIGTLEKIVNADFSQDFLCDIYVACNFAGILYLLLYSIIQRRTLGNRKQELDKDKDTPNDYALLVRHVPKTFTEMKLK
jgi:hypothetical protein